MGERRPRMRGRVRPRRARRGRRTRARPSPSGTRRSSMCSTKSPSSLRGTSGIHIAVCVRHDASVVSTWRRAVGVVDADVRDERLGGGGPALARRRPVRDERERVRRPGAHEARHVGGLVVLLVGIRVRRPLRGPGPVDVQLVLLTGRRVHARAHDRAARDGRSPCGSARSRPSQYRSPRPARPWGRCPSAGSTPRPSRRRRAPCRSGPRPSTDRTAPTRPACAPSTSTCGRARAGEPAPRRRPADCSPRCRCRTRRCASAAVGASVTTSS